MRGFAVIFPGLAEKNCANQAQFFFHGGKKRYFDLYPKIPLRSDVYRMVWSFYLLNAKCGT
jgi:hypothetical protein